MYVCSENKKKTCKDNNRTLQNDGRDGKGLD